MANNRHTFGISNTVANPFLTWMEWNLPWQPSEQGGARDRRAAVD